MNVVGPLAAVPLHAAVIEEAAIVVDGLPGCERAAGGAPLLDAAHASDPKTKAVAAQLKALGLSSALIVDGSDIDRNFQLAARNIPGVDLLPQQGANVYDILRRDTLVLTRQAVEQLQERLR